MKIVVAYIPVWHRGYERVLEAVQPDEVLLLDKDAFVADFPELRKDIRALTPSAVAQVLRSLYPQMSVSVLSRETVQLENANTYVFVDDELTRFVAAELFAGVTIEWYSAFLRWDKEHILKPVEVVADVQLDAKNVAALPSFLQEFAKHSSDWWRQVAAAVVKDGEVIAVAYNKHTPSEHEPYYNGDMRGLFHKAEYVEVNSSLHAEAAVIGAAARKGVSLEGAELYATTFACPYCARVIAHSGIKTFYFSEGYSMADGAEYLKECGVRLVGLANDSK